jgi:hypothetical protein
VTALEHRAEARTRGTIHSVRDRFAGGPSSESDGDR